jgi:hypothetical protein
MSRKRHRRIAKKRGRAKSPSAAQAGPATGKLRPPRLAKRRPWWRRHRFRKTLKVFGVGFAILTPIATALGFYLDIGDFRSQRAASRPPAADIVFFERGKDGYKLVDPMNVVLNPTADEINRKQFAVPINLAVRNQESEQLEATRVEIYYPKDVKVKPTGKPRIDPDNRVLIYEHNLEDLQAVDNYTPLDTVDTLYFPFSIDYSTGIAVGPDLSIAELMIGSQWVRFPNGLELNVKVFARGRPPLNGRIRLLIGERAGDPSPSGEFKEGTLTAKDLTLFHHLGREMRTAPNKWVARDLGKSHLLMYRKLRYRGGTFGLLIIDGKLRQVAADVDTDGYLDFNLVDTTAPGSPNFITTPLAPERMFDTPKPTGEGYVKTVQP